MDTPSICNSHSPAAPVSNQALCTIVTYTTNKQKCPLKNFSTKPFVFLYFDKDNSKFFYSAPNDTTIYVKCSENDGTYEDNSYVINGIGQVQYKPDCSINLQDGTSYRTPKALGRKQLNDGQLLQINDMAPYNSSYKLTMTKQIREEIVLSPITSYSDLTDKEHHSNRAAMNWHTLIIILFSLILIAMITWMCREQCHKLLQETKAFRLPIPTPSAPPQQPQYPNSPYPTRPAYPKATYTASTEDVFLSSINKTNPTPPTPSILKKTVTFPSEKQQN
jgi:hypothetical protein